MRCTFGKSQLSIMPALQPGLMFVAKARSPPKKVLHLGRLHFLCPYIKNVNYNLECFSLTGLPAWSNVYKIGTEPTLIGASFERVWPQN
jgi:hypothetical protein